MKSIHQILSIFLVFLVLPIQAQLINYRTKDKKAIKLYEEGRSLFFRGMDEGNDGLLELAQINLLQALERDSNFTEAISLIAGVYAQRNNKEASIKYLKKAVSKVPVSRPDDFFLLARFEMEKGFYAEAKANFKRFLSYQKISPRMASQAKQDVKNCDFAILAMRNPVPFEPINLGPSINSIYDEYFPCLTADDNTILYTRQIESERFRGKQQEDFYMANRNKENWNKSYNIKRPINTENNEGAPTLSADGQILVFTACASPYDGYGPNRKGFGSCDLFVSQRIGDSWTAPVNMGPPINTNKWETQPSLASDGKTLYFVRGTVTRSGINGQDIYMTQIDDEGRWSEPVPLSPNINTEKREESVFIHPDGKTLYFASDGRPGMGGLDIYISKKDDDGNWSPAKNLGYPINTSSNENSLLVDAAGELAYFASNREGGLGGLDLYHFKLPKKFKPEAVTYLKGKVYDIKTKKPLESKFELIDLETGELAIESYSNRGNGEFLVALPTNKNYALNVSRDGYLFYSENFSLKGNSDVTDPFIKDVPLQPIEVGEKVILRNIFFETAKYDLKSESKAELQKLIDFLTQNPTLKIELSGHTDSVGKDEDNQTLSHNRAKAVYDYLISKKIDSERLKYKGYGEKQPITTNETEAGRAQNRRTEFKILEQ